MKHKISLPILALMLAVMACNIQSARPTPSITSIPASTNTPLAPAPTATDTSSSPVTSLPPTLTNTIAPVPSVPANLTMDILKNGTYHTPAYDRTVSLVNGSFSEGSGASAFSVQMLGVSAFGDLNGDGKTDAAIILDESGGGSGDFESVIAVLNQGGLPHQVSQVQLGDRVQIKSADISSGVIHLDMLVHGPADPLCCPSLSQKQNYWLIDSHLWLMRVISTIVGSDHVIVIESPGIWSTVSSPFPVNGSMTFLPFENTLAYRIYTTDGTKINESSVTVTPTQGTAGKFSQAFNLSSAGITNWVIIQFVDVSAADGSTIALGSVILKAH